MDHKIIASALCLLFICHSSYGKSVKVDDQFDYLLLASFWPISSCFYFEQKGESCHISPDVSGWTIHGLWPSRINSTTLPSDCDSSMPFNYSAIESLRPQLNKYWPYFNSDGNITFLWDHEWVKHGTCAYSLAETRGEFNFFHKTLEMHSKLDITGILKQSNVVPSNITTYKREDFYNAFTQHYKYKPVIVCDYDRKLHKTYIDQVYLCFNKQFEPQDCYPQEGTSYYEDCRATDEIHYLIYKTKQSSTKTGKPLMFESELKH